MALPGYTEYQRREYCKDVRCPVQFLLDAHDGKTAEEESLRGICKSRCIHSTYEFHHWLIEHGYVLLRPEA